MIAQQVKQFFPEAVSAQYDSIPSIYKLAQSVTLSEDGTQVFIVVDIPTTAEIKENQEIHLYIDGRKDHLTTQIISKSENCIVVSVWKNFNPDSSVFVYGVFVDDFNVLNAPYINGLNIAGIQELNKENIELRNRVTSLEASVLLLQTQINKLISSTL
jgi:hypothetical protein